MLGRDHCLSSVRDAVGRTPLVRLRSLDTETPGVEIWGKLEFTNPGGSVKDRPARQMLIDAEQRGVLKPGMSIIDSTSGNTGVALALYGVASGYEVTLVMPENVSSVRKHMLRAFGAHIIYSDPMEGSDGAIRLVQKIVQEEPMRYFYTNQYGNEANWKAHYLTTGMELIEEVGDKMTHFLAGIGTSGTVMGTGRRLKEHRSGIKVIGVEPDDEFHGLEGLKFIKSSIVPGIYDASVLDDTRYVETDAGWNTAERLAHAEGLLVGHSSGAVACAALQLAKDLSQEGRRGFVVAILPDHASRYVEVARPSEADTV